MRRSASALTLLALHCLGAGKAVMCSQAVAPGSETAEWIAGHVDERDTGRDSRLEMTMRIFDRQKRRRERALTISTLRKQEPRGDRVLVRFLSPSDIRGTGLLVWEHPGAEDERFLYLPALSRVRRIAGSEKQDSFVGSDLSYEDIGGRDFADYTYAIADRNATWKDQAGQPHPAWRLESRSKDSTTAYPRVVSLVRKDIFVVVAAEVFNRRDEREKLYEVRRLERPDGVWTVMDATMTNELQQTRTDLIVNVARYNVGLTDASFSRRELEQSGK